MLVGTGGTAGTASALSRVIESLFGETIAAHQLQPDADVALKVLRAPAVGAQLTGQVTAAADLLGVDLNQVLPQGSWDHEILRSNDGSRKAAFHRMELMLSSYRELGQSVEVPRGGTSVKWRADCRKS